MVNRMLRSNVIPLIWMTLHREVRRIEQWIDNARRKVSLLMQRQRGIQPVVGVVHLSRVHSLWMRSVPAPTAFQILFDRFSVPDSPVRNGVHDMQSSFLGFLSLQALRCYCKAADSHVGDASIFDGCGNTTDFVSIGLLRLVELELRGMRLGQQNARCVVEKLSKDSGWLNEPVSAEISRLLVTEWA